VEFRVLELVKMGFVDMDILVAINAGKLIAIFTLVVLFVLLDAMLTPSVYMVGVVHFL